MRPDHPDSATGPDGELLTRIARGDAESLAAFFRRHHGDVYRFALHMTASQAAADDVTQETFLAVMRDAARYEPGRATATAWLCGIARNFVRRRFERDRPFQPLDDIADDEHLVDGDADPLGDLRRAERVEAVRRAVLSLPIRYREAVVLCDLQELSYVDAAEALGCAVGTVRSRLHRGRALLASKLAPRADAAPNMDAANSTETSSGFSRPDHAVADELPERGAGTIKRMRVVSNARNLA
ncbi:MAG TPA: RNA polymerase sigma factor [Vicinamibacterales bacterium]|nr:RNA polymerase sigma factor [Vicinamibacterales bacterium]